MENTTTNKEILFKDLNAEEDNPEITEIESLCTDCEESGTTRILLTKIPFFKDVILLSFECPHCGNRNNEIQSAEAVQDQGIKITSKIKNAADLNRKVVKQSSASFSIPELEFESEPFTQKGVLTTVEGLLQNAIDGLQQQQAVRKIMDPVNAAKIDDLIGTLTLYCSGTKEFTLIVEDMSGNSLIENLNAPGQDPNTVIEHFERSTEQNEKLGFFKDDTEANEEKPAESNTLDLQGEVLQFPTNCQECHSPAVTNMKVVQIPHFKEVIIMASNCDTCGYKTNEVKSGGGVEPFGTKTSLRLTDILDLSRDILKSETCDVMIPELEFEIRSGTIGGKFTTVEGLLVDFKKQVQTLHPFASGDSSSGGNRDKLKAFLDRLDKVIAGEEMVTMILDDPVGNSYIQNKYAPDPDPELKIEKYERTFDQNEDLGLNDMDTGEGKINQNDKKDLKSSVKL